MVLKDSMVFSALKALKVLKLLKGLERSVKVQRGPEWSKNVLKS